MEQDKRRKPWDVISLLIGMLACAIGIIAIQHTDIGNIRQDIAGMGYKIDAFQAEMRNVHGRVCALEERTK